MTGPTKKRCTELIRLCSGLDFFPADGAIRELLVTTLQRRAVSDDHAERVIEKWLESERRAPTISDIVSLAAAVNPTPVTAARKMNRDCELCEGQGYMTRTRSDGISGALRCPNGCAVPGSFFHSVGAWDYLAERKQFELKRAALSNKTVVTLGLKPDGSTQEL